MTADIIIRPTTKEDLPAIRAVLNDVIANTDYYLSERLKTETDMQDWFGAHQKEPYVVFTAFSGDEFAGWVSLSSFRMIDGYDTTAELSVYVHPAHYRKGIADKLMWEIEAYAKRQKLLHCIISVITSDNAVSIALHEKHGYAVNTILREVGYKKGRYKDVVMMTKLL